jgi:NitT/TauT family transport system substrate-binding protein
MRLKPAGIALIILLLILCPLGAGASYVALKGAAGGPLGARATATATAIRGSFPAAPTTAATTVAANPTTAAANPTTAAANRTPVANMTPTTVRSTSPAPGASGGPTTTTVAARPSTAPGGVPTVAGPTPTGVRAGVATPGAIAATGLTVAYDTYAPYFPVRIAETQGYFRSRNLAVRQVAFGLNGDYDEVQRRAALKSGEFDVLLTTLDAVALFPDDDTGKVVAIVDESAGADKIVARPEIARLNDLKGKTIAFSAGSVAEFYLYASLNLVGLKASDVQLRPVESVDAAVALFKNRQVDAVVGWEPTIQGAIDSGGKVLLGSDNYRAILDVMVVSTKALREKPAAVQSFIDAWFEATKLTTDDPQAAGAAVVKSGDSDWTGIARPSDFTDALKLVAQATLGQNAFALRDNTVVGNRLTEIGNIWKAGGKSLATLTPANLIDGGFVQRANAQGGLGSNSPPLNASFTLTQQITVPALGGGQTQAVAELPLKQIEFLPDSAILTDAGRTALLQQVVPILKQTPGLYLKVEGSAYQPVGDTPQANEAFARSRAQAVIYFLITQGIDANRFIEGYVAPRFPGSQNPAEQQQDRRVVFTLVQQGGR